MNRRPLHALLALSLLAQCPPPEPMPDVYVPPEPLPPPFRDNAKLRAAEVKRARRAAKRKRS